MIRYTLLAAALLPLASGFALAQTGPPRPPAPPAPPPGVSTLAGSEWTGSETLTGFAKLTFRFQDPTNVTMIDTQGSWPGTYAQQGSQITLQFFNGAVTYKGQLAGTDLSGTATNKAGTQWSFKVSRQGGGTPVTPPPDGVGPVTADNLAEYLRKMGLEPKTVTPQTGLPYCVIQMKESDGWTFEIEATAQKTGGIWLAAALPQLPRVEEIPAAKLLQLLEANQTAAPCFFSYRASDNRLCMRLEVLGRRPSEQDFRADLRTLTNQVRRTYSRWDPTQWR